MRRRQKRYAKRTDFRSSDIAWLGRIPSEWAINRLKHIASWKSGDNITAQSISQDGEYPVYGGNGLRGYTSSFTHDGEYVLVGRQGAHCGNVHFVTGKFWASEHAVVVTLKPKYSSAWFANLLRGMTLNQYSESAAQPGLSVDRIQNLSAPVPPIAEQEAIAAFLDRETGRIDGLVAKKERLIELLQEKRTALISHAVTKGLNPDAKMKDAGVEWLRQVPEHWCVTKLVFVTERVGDGLHGTPEYLDGSGLYFVNGNNLVAEHIRFFDNTREVTATAYQTHKLPLGEETVLLSINGTIGNLGLYRGEKIMLGKSAAFINCKPKLDRLFLTKYLQSNPVRRYFDLELTGTTISNLSLASIRQTPILLPPLSEQIEIIGAIEQQTSKLDALIDTVTLAIERLREYRTALISAAVTGKIDIRNVVTTHGEEIQ